MFTARMHALLISSVIVLTGCQSSKQEMMVRNVKKIAPKMIYSAKNIKTHATQLLDDHIDVLNEQGLREGYTLSRKEVHEQGAIHRAVHLYIFDTQGEHILLQKRAATVDHDPNKYSISVVGHVDAGEYSHMAVKRELKEELGISIDHDIEFLFSFRQDAELSPSYIDRQINDLYVCYIDQNQPIKFDKRDVSTIEWVSFKAFQKMVEAASRGQGDLAPVYTYSCTDLIYFLSHKNQKC